MEFNILFFDPILWIAKQHFIQRIDDDLRVLLSGSADAKPIVELPEMSPSCNNAVSQQLIINFFHITLHINKNKVGIALDILKAAAFKILFHHLDRLSIQGHAALKILLIFL